MSDLQSEMYKKMNNLASPFKSGNVHISNTVIPPTAPHNKKGLFMKTGITKNQRSVSITWKV